MRKKSYKESLIIANPPFEEEVPSDKLKEYEDKDRNKKIILLIIINILLLLLLAGLYFFILRENPKSSGGVNNTAAGNIFVVHSSTYFGGLINDTSLYNSKNKAFEYKFYIENQNDLDVSYKIYIIDLIEKEMGNNYVSRKDLTYSLFVNKNEVISSRNLDLITGDILYQSIINKNSKQDYILKIWTTNNDSQYYKFQLTVEEMRGKN